MKRNFPMANRDKMVAALYVDVKKGPYGNITNVDLWGVERDARLYEGPYPVVAHPSCAPWGNFSWRSGGGDSKIDGDRSCALIAVDQVRRFGGVLEHPSGSKLWSAMNLPKPGEGKDEFGGWTLAVKQVDWNHPCEKKTWLYIVGVDPKDIPSLPSPKTPTHVIEGGLGTTLPRLPKSQRHLTPIDFAKWLVKLARKVNPQKVGLQVRKENPLTHRDRFVSDDIRFVLAMADVKDGKAKLIGQSWLSDGNQIIEIESNQLSNNPVDEEDFSGSIEIGERFLTRPLKDYENWKRAWWRESLQNSIDAGATEIKLGATKNQDGTWTVFCDDNGKGMTFEQVRSYFLRMGESGKSSAGSSIVGGFGKAKELLVLPWIQWTIEIDGTKIVGRGLPFKKIPSGPRKGVRIEVIMPPDNFTTLQEARSVLERSDLRQKIFVGNELFPSKEYLSVKDKIQSIEGKGDIFVKRTPGEGHWTMLIRHHGLFMFEIYTSKIEAIVILELTGPSIELLASNRDAFADYTIKSGVSDFISRLAKDPSSSLLPKTKKLRKLYRGEGTFEAQATTRTADIMRKHPDILSSKEMSDQDIEELAESIGKPFDISREEKEESGSIFQDTKKDFLNSLRSTSETAREIIKNVPKEGFDDNMRIIEALVWKPDFFIYNENADQGVNKIFLPETMTPTTLRLARVWSEVCKFVLLQIKLFEPFGIGFCFDKNARAIFLKEDGTSWILLNPYKNPSNEDEGILRPTDDKDLARIYACAIHECSHMQGYDYHDESFASRMTENVALCAPGWRHVKKIALSVPMKGQVVRGSRNK